MKNLRIEGIRKTFHQTEILKGIDIAIEPGEFLILVGPSGCGKSTLLSMIAGLDHPTEGRIHLGERDITDLPSKDRDIAMVFQSYALYPNMTVSENIAFALEMRGVAKPQRQDKVKQVAATLQIEHLLERRPAQLSGGQRQRVAMGRALARDPQLFLFDEPLSNLDAKLRVEMRAEIKQLHQRTRTTTVYVTHDQVEAMTLGDRIAVMKDGQVQQFGTPQDIYQRPATVFVAEFIGSPAINWIPALHDGEALRAHGLPLATPQPLAAGQYLYGLRPEALSLAAEGIPGHIDMVEPTGPETYVRVDTPLGRLTTRVPGVPSERVGDTVHLNWSAQAAHVFEAATQQRVRA